MRRFVRGERDEQRSTNERRFGMDADATGVVQGVDFVFLWTTDFERAAGFLVDVLACVSGQAQPMNEE